MLIFDSRLKFGSRNMGAGFTNLKEQIKDTEREKKLKQAQVSH